MSVSIRDGWEEVESRHSMLVDLLLMYLSSLKETGVFFPTFNRQEFNSFP